jgi:hypothetical protein
MVENQFYNLIRVERQGLIRVWSLLSTLKLPFYHLMLLNLQAVEFMPQSSLNLAAITTLDLIRMFLQFRDTFRGQGYSIIFSSLNIRYHIMHL